MGKRSQKRTLHSEKDNAGCISGLISIFDFGHGHSTQKLLSDRRRGSGRHSVGNGYSKNKLNFLTNYEENPRDLDNVEGSQVESVDLGTTSVKTLMEEEMFRVLHPKENPNAEFEQIRTNFGRRVQVEKNQKLANETCKAAYDILVNDLKAPTSLESDHSAYPNPVEMFSYNLLAALMEQFCGDSPQCQEMHVDYKNGTDSCPAHKSTGDKMHSQLDQPDTQLVQNHSFLQNALSEVVEALLSHNIDSKQLTCDTTLHQSKEFINALQLLNSNKEVFLKLLQDPNTLLGKHFQNLQNAQEEKFSKLGTCKISEGSEMLEEEISGSRQCDEPLSCKQFHKQNVHDFFRKDKSRGTNPSKGSDSSQALKRIVVLKPTPTRIPNPPNMNSPSSSPQSHHSSRTIGDNERVASRFSLREIKRRLKHVIGEGRKEQHLISGNGLRHRIPYVSQDSRDIGKRIAADGAGTDLAHEISRDDGQASQLSTGAKRRDKKSKSKESQTNVECEIASSRAANMTSASNLLFRESYYRREAKKQLAEMLNSGDEDVGLPTKRISKTLGGMFSLPEHQLFPKVSPGRDKEPGLSPSQMIFSPLWQCKQENASNCLSPIRQNVENSPCTDSNPNIKLQELDLSPALLNVQLKENISIGEASSPKGCEEITETVNTECIEESKEIVATVDTEYHDDSKEIIEAVDTEYSEESSPLDVISDSNISGPTDVAESCKDMRSSASSRLNLAEEITRPIGPLASIPPGSLLIHNIEAPEKLIEKPERPSPVSILDPLFLEDIISPGSTTSEHADNLIEPRQLHFEEYHSSAVVLTNSDPRTILRNHVEEMGTMFMYVRALLEASGLVYDRMSERWHSRDQLLDPSLYDEVETSSGQVPDDLKLHFDCINEVLEEIRGRFFSCTPWVSFARSNIHPIPLGENLIQEVWKGMDWQLIPQFPCTLDHIIGKDMESRTWMDLRFETEFIGTEMGDVILVEIMEDMILELWD